MKSEKGKPVFPGEVDAILADKIIEHTQKNTESGGRDANSTSAFPPTQKFSCCGNMSKNKCVFMCIFFISILLGIVAFVIVKPKLMGIKRPKRFDFFG
jgi:hypothetical protein